MRITRVETDEGVAGASSIGYGLARLSAALDVPIASGENNFGKRQFRELFERRAVDVVQPDLRRAGGVTECLEIGLMADAFGVP